MVRNWMYFERTLASFFKIRCSELKDGVEDNCRKTVEIGVNEDRRLIIVAAELNGRPWMAGLEHPVTEMSRQEVSYLIFINTWVHGMSCDSYVRYHQV